MPSLALLSDQDIYDFIDNITEQLIKNKTFKNLLELTPHERAKINYQRPGSISELRQKIQQFLVEKSQKNDLNKREIFTAALAATTDPELAEIAQLGKSALRNEQLMRILWNKFECQSKIALFLGVNRSSVNRRLKDFNIEKS